jgi:hypothetical protein
LLRDHHTVAKSDHHNLTANFPGIIVAGRALHRFKVTDAARNGTVSEHRYFSNLGPNDFC